MKSQSQIPPGGVASPNLPKGISSWVILAMLGVTSSIVSMVMPSEQMGAMPIVGGIFGIALAAYFMLYAGIDIFARAIFVPIVSAVIYPCAYFGSMLALKLPLPTFGSSEDETIATLVFVGGVIGGFLLLLTVLWCLKTPSLTVRGMLGRAAAGSLFSGLLGVVGWILGDSLGRELWKLLPTSPFPSVHSFNFCSLYFIWQPAMAVFIGILNHGAQKHTATSSPSIPASLAALRKEKSVPEKRMPLAVPAVCLALVLGAALPSRIRLAVRERTQEIEAAERPSTSGLAPFRSMSVDQALILSDIAGSHSSPPVVREELPSNDKGFELPSGFYYSVSYSPEADNFPQAAYGPYAVLVSVEQYPNTEWALYLAKYRTSSYYSSDNPKQHAVVTKFQNKVRSNVLEDSSIRGQVYYMWPSGDNVVKVLYNRHPEIEAVLQAYLDKYPSSLH
jgi:hypothetical protein